MDKCIVHGLRSGEVSIPASKSMAHRMIIAAALSKKNITILCRGTSKDIEATIRCLNAMGAFIEHKGDEITVSKSSFHVEEPSLLDLYCGESGSTLRFLLPVVGALKLNAVFHMEGELGNRPMDELKKVLILHGMNIEKRGNLLYAGGALYPGDYEIPGNISSQYISGLLFALPLLNGDSKLTVTESIESSDYIAMTENVLSLAKVKYTHEDSVYYIEASEYNLDNGASVESDWSNAAFFLCMGAMSKEGITVFNMNTASAQGDKAILKVLKQFGASIDISSDAHDGDVGSHSSTITVKKSCETGIKPDNIIIDASQIPDLVPVICSLACSVCATTTIKGAQRLRLKESDRIKTTVAFLRALGGDITEKDDGMIIRGVSTLKGGVCDGANDHRIAMAAATASLICREDVTVKGAECVAKSFPTFWEVFESCKRVETD